MAAQLFFPETIIIDNCLFIKESRNTDYMESHWKNAETAADLEKIINDVCFGIFYIIGAFFVIIRAFDFLGLDITKQIDVPCSHL